MSTRGYFGVAVYRPKTDTNVGTLWRSAHVFGASFMSIIGARYHRQPSDTMDSARHVPLYHYPDFAAFLSALPERCELLAVEMTSNARALPGYHHPERAVYLLGPEDGSLPPDVLAAARSKLVIPSARCLNLAVAGSIVLYGRIAKQPNAGERAA